MAAKAEKKESVPAGEVLAGFIQKNRRRIIVGFVCLAALVGGIIGGYSIRNSMRTRGISQVEAFNERYEALRFDINESAKAEEINALLEELETFAAKQSGYPGARAYIIIANIRGDQKSWAEAEQAWTRAAQRGGKSYLAPVAWFNAAVAAEEQGNLENAIDLYRRTIDYADMFPAAARALFSVGRLWEARQDKEAAISAYQELIDKWPDETAWTSLANSRIIALR
jgi:tetratricopeptide (TPR) repeat protein